MTNNDNLKKAYLPLSLGANGAIGTAITTVDIASSFNIIASASNLNFTLPNPTDVNFSDIVEVGGASTNVNSFTINTQKVAATGEFAYLRWNGVNWQILNPNSLSGNIVAITPYNAGVETVIAFDGLEMKWHQAGSSFDGITIRTQAGTRSLRYSATEWYIANAAADGGKSTWGSNNAWYALPILGATATIINTVYPYAQNVTTTFLGMGNPALPNADMRVYFLFDDTNKVTYRIFLDKQGSTGEITTAQTGTCMIVVEKLGITTNQILTAGQGTDLTGGVVTNLGSTFGFATRLTNQTVTPANTFMSVIWGTTIGNNVTLANTVSPFTITQAGTYRILFHASHDDNGVVSGSFQQQRITVNGAAVGMTSGWDSATNLRVAGSVEYIGVLSVGNIVGGQVNHSTINGNTIANCTMSIQRIL
jgi:hypothetical protein